MTPRYIKTPEFEGTALIVEGYDKDPEWYDDEHYGEVETLEEWDDDYDDYFDPMLIDTNEEYYNEYYNG